MEDILQRVYLGNSIGRYLAAAGLLLATLALLAAAKALVVRRLERWAAATETTLDDFLVALLKDTAVPLMTIGAFALAAHGLTFHPSLAKMGKLAWTAVITYFGVKFVLQALLYALKQRWSGGPPSQSQAMEAVLPVLQTAAWTLGVIFFLDNAGVKISAVVTGLGIGGIAVALAAQAVLGDLFSYIAILCDRPFVIGDFIVVDDLMGTVEKVGIKTTRIRSLSGELLVLPNAALTSSRIRNFQAMSQRRVVFTLGVTYETPNDKLKEIPALLKRIVEEASDTAFDRSHFAAYGESSLDFETVYFVKLSDYNRHMDIQQRIFFAVKDEFDKRGIAFAYPTRTIHTAPAS